MSERTASQELKNLIRKLSKIGIAISREKNIDSIWK
ncbi:diguanylate cyclase [Caldicellulosiruptor acetigenus I77R1B]|uniref:Diguanylate cyclase n=2 Tax=Caldicellulosiruptor acetigenus TaxID=301953 RepID=G2PZ65_9FIRM|nr:hypothetical protein [Caldicellulosiruptor acetigenus]ADQ40354.1 diguanylate cyclase [Caldicellulosiruptor acetigenus I77R1B]AEM74110.1 diguanylate cyclase [Caldicellulosiruptor acetigenus 6A]